MKEFKFKSFHEIEELISILNTKDEDTLKKIKDEQEIDTGEVITSEDKARVRQELENYYERLRQYILDREFTNADQDILEVVRKQRWISKAAGAFLVKLYTTKNAKRVIKVCKNIDGKNVIVNKGKNEKIPYPAIYLSLHRDDIDNFIPINEIEGPAPILHGATVNDWLLKAQKSTGVIPVDKEDKESKKNSKLDVCKILLNGISVFIYPESTHLLSPNKLWLPWEWGAIDIARITGLPIVPIVRDYEYSDEKKLLGGLKISETYSMYGSPIYVGLEDSTSKIAEEVERQWWDLKYDAMLEKVQTSSKTVTKGWRDALKMMSNAIGQFLQPNVSPKLEFKMLIKLRVAKLKNHFKNALKILFENDKNSEKIIISEKKCHHSKDVTDQYVDVLKNHLYPGLKFAGLTPQYERRNARGANAYRYKRGESYINDHPIDKDGNLVVPNVIPGQFDEDGTFGPGEIIEHEDLCPESAWAFPDYMQFRVAHAFDEDDAKLVDPTVKQYKILRRVPPKVQPKREK